MEQFALAAQNRFIISYPAPNGAARAQQDYLTFSGIDYLSKALHRGVHHGLALTQSQLRSLTRTNPVLTGPSGHSERDRNVTWELLLAALAAPFTSNPRLVEPPDVICGYQTFEVGFSAKVVYSRSPAEVRKDVVKASRQLDGVAVDFGFIALNLVEVFPHQQFMKDFVDHQRVNAAEFEFVVDEWVRKFVEAQEFNRVAPRLKSTKALAIVIFVPTALHFAGQLCPYYRIHYVCLGETEERALPFLTALNQSSQAVLRWREEAG